MAIYTIEPYQCEPLHGSSSDEFNQTSESEGTDETPNNSARLVNHNW